jgi:Flp pilus assembly protein TadG
MRFFREECGQTLVFTALLMCCLMGFMALAVDMGVLFRTQRRLQTAADAAAVAAGLASDYGMTVTGCGTGVSSVTCAAYQAAGANLCSPADTACKTAVTNRTTVNIPPLNGWHTGAEYIEVIIKQPTPAVFMGTFGGLFYGGSTTSYNPMTVGARAVSGIVAGQACAYALNPTVADAVDVQGNATMNMPHCSIQINSSNDTALCSTGSKSSIISDGIDIVGAQNPKGKCNKTQPNATTGVQPVPDPFASLPRPTCTSGTGGNANSVGGVSPTITGYNSSTGAVTVTNKAGTSITITPTKQTDPADTQTNPPFMNVVCFTDANITIAPNLTLGTASLDEMFVFSGNLTMGSSDTIVGTMDITGSGTLTPNNTVLNMTAPTSDNNYLYNGIAVFYTSSADSCDSSYKGPDSACVQMQFGSGYGSLDGMVYAPSAAVYLQDSGGNSGPKVYTAIVADTIWDKSAYLEITDNYNLVHTTSPLNHVALVE